MAQRFTVGLLLALVFTFGAPALVAQEPARNPGDTTVVNFFVPGQFKKALAAAKTRNRCLVIKGVAFGMDQKGAACATKGLW